MDLTSTKKKNASKTLVKKCHFCGHVNYVEVEPKRCGSCKKSFLPSSYFSKVHAKNEKEFDALFSDASELHEDDLVKGLNALWY